MLKTEKQETENEKDEYLTEKKKNYFILFERRFF